MIISSLPRGTARSSENSSSFLMEKFPDSSVSQHENSISIRECYQRHIFFLSFAFLTKICSSVYTHATANAPYRGRLRRSSDKIHLANITRACTLLPSQLTSFPQLAVYFSIKPNGQFEKFKCTSALKL